MTQKVRCQSCSLPLDNGFFGTEENGSFSEEYCRFCYQKGEFLEKDLTLEQLLSRQLDFMTRKLKVSEDKAKEFCTAVLPNLKRWKQER